MEITKLSQLDIINGSYTYADYLTWKIGQAVELIKGKIFELSAPNRKHQAISRNLTLLIGNQFHNHKCRFYAAPFDVRLYNNQKSLKANKDIYSVVQPDLCIICDLEKLDDQGCIGAPDLIIEILSPGNSSKEMKAKKMLYEESGVLEYLIFNPEHFNVLQFVLGTNNQFELGGIFVEEDMFISKIFPELEINLREVFAST
jgi:Uma2 family endonuclease